MLDGEQVVRAAAVQVGRMVTLGVHRIGRDQHAVQVADLVQQPGEHGDLIGFAVHRDLCADHAGAVIQARHQVRRGALAGPGAAQRLAVHRQGRPRAWYPAGREPGRDPGAERPVQRGRIHGGQHPPDGDQVRDSARYSQLRPQLRRGIAGPLEDRRIRPRPGKRRAHCQRQNRSQAIAHAARVTRIRYLRQRLQQPACRRARQRPPGPGKVSKLASSQPHR